MAHRLGVGVPVPQVPEQTPEAIYVILQEQIMRSSCWLVIVDVPVPLRAHDHGRDSIGSSGTQSERTVGSLCASVLQFAEGILNLISGRAVEQIGRAKVPCIRHVARSDAGGLDGPHQLVLVADLQGACMSTQHGPRRCTLRRPPMSRVRSSIYVKNTSTTTTIRRFTQTGRFLL